jgi:hypothetical protein
LLKFRFRLVFHNVCNVRLVVDDVGAEIMTEEVFSFYDQLIDDMGQKGPGKIDHQKIYQ